MKQRHLILVDEQSQSSRLQGIAANLHEEGIELIYQEINPNDYVTRQEDGDLVFNNKSFIQNLKAVPFLHHLDMFATDYNLIDNQLKGIDVLSMFGELKPLFSKKVVIYSAQIESVIQDILMRKDESFEEQVSRLKLLARYDVEYMKSEGEFGTKLKNLIEKEPNMSIDDQLSESLMAIDSNDIHCAIPPYDHMTLVEIANLLISKDQNSIKLKKEISDHIMAILTKVDGYE